MILNMKEKPVVNFCDIDGGECFTYKDNYYVMAYDDDVDEWFGVNLSDGSVKRFDSKDKVQKLIAEVTFREPFREF